MSGLSDFTARERQILEFALRWFLNGAYNRRDIAELRLAEAEAEKYMEDARVAERLLEKLTGGKE